MMDNNAETSAAASLRAKTLCRKCVILVNGWFGKNQSMYDQCLVCAMVQTNLFLLLNSIYYISYYKQLPKVIIQGCFQ